MSAIQHAKDHLVTLTGLPKDALHVYVGLLVFLGVAIVSRRPLRAWTPWLCVLAAACLGELVDMLDELASVGHWNRAASLHDLWNTLMWPTVILLSARLGLIRAQ